MKELKSLCNNFIELTPKQKKNLILIKINSTRTMILSFGSIGIIITSISIINLAIKKKKKM